MDSIQAIILGIVEGVTEYLPVSSTGHLILAQRVLGIGHGEAADAFAICIQAGAILAVLGLYFSRVRQMVAGLLGRDPEGLRLAGNVLTAFLPAVVLGLMFEKRIKEHLFNLPAITFAWFAGGIAILAVVSWRQRRAMPDRPGRELPELTVAGAVLIGLAQCAAMWPGTSRSLTTIVGGLLVGLQVSAAVEFSFLLGLVTLSAATAHDVLTHGAALIGAYSSSSMALGFAAATLAAAISVKWMVGYLRNHGLAAFGWYRVCLAAAVAAFLLLGPRG
jgi:undecaprenyl-diphosphatase